MKPTRTTLLSTALALTMFTGAHAQSQGADLRQDGPGRMDPARMEQMMAKRSAQLKAKLQITPEQEPAFNAFISAIKPPAGMMGKRPEPAELATLSTPERIDRMRALRQQRSNEMNAAMDRRDDATKMFYATLNGEQKKVFDEAHASMLQRMGEHRMGEGRRP